MQVYRKAMERQNRQNVDLSPEKTGGDSFISGMLAKVNSALLILFVAEVAYMRIGLDVALVLFLFLTSLALGTIVPVRGDVKFAERVLLQLSCGLGIVGFAVWASTFHNVGYRPLFVVFSLSVIAMRYRPVGKTLKDIGRALLSESKENGFLFTILLLSLMFYVVKASYPIIQYDALTKHISIPIKILHSSNWDYNVIESVYYGDYAILSHMYFLYLMALGGTKALALFNMVISFFILFILLRLAIKIHADSIIFVNSVSLVYLSTPIFYALSTIIYIDLLPVFFIFSTLLLLKYLDNEMIFKNMYLISFLLGCAFFAKQHALYLGFPIALALLYVFVRNYVLNYAGFVRLMGRALMLIFLFLLPFLPALLVVWHKTGNPVFPFMNAIFNSNYYSHVNFADPFQDHPLGLSVASILSMVFHTNKNMEFLPGGLGFYLLLLFLLPVALFIKRQRFYIMLAILCLFSYYLSTIFTSNIRYMLGSLILAVPVSLSASFYVNSAVKNTKWRNALFSAFIILLLIPNMVFIFASHYWTFEKEMLYPNESLTKNDNESVLSLIKGKKVRVLSNNDVFRGTFKGEFYTISWLNDLFVRELNNKDITPQQFLQSFDYYLIAKKMPQTTYVPKEFFSLNNPDIMNMLTLVKESDSHLLYKVQKKGELVLLSQSFPTPLRVNVKQSVLREIRNNSEGYKIEIDAERTDDKNDSIGRFQINWHDEKGNMVNVSLIPFVLDEKRKVYVSPWIENIPKEAKTGIVYLTSHSEKNILIHSFKVLGKPRDVVQEALGVYNKKWPHLSTL